MKILIADDHQIVRYGLKLVLKSIWPKCIILEADDLDVAIGLISEHNVSLTIFDVNMPGSDRLVEVIRFIMKEAKVVIFSGFDKRSPLIESLIGAGADMFLFKDSSVEEIKLGLSSLFNDNL